MRVIRDKEMNGLLLIPLFNQYGLHRCNVRDCDKRPKAIVIEFEMNGSEVQPFAICEDHDNEFTTKGEINCIIDWN